MIPRPRAWPPPQWATAMSARCLWMATLPLWPDWLWVNVKSSASNGGDNVYAETSIDLTFTVTAPVKADQKSPLTLSTTKLSLESDKLPLYTTVVMYLSMEDLVTVSCQQWHQTRTVPSWRQGQKTVHGGDIFTITGAVQDCICYCYIH